MKNIICLLCTFISITISAQVNTSYFEAKNAFKTYSKLKQIPTNQKGIVLNIMQKENTLKLIEENKKMEGQNIPFQFGYGIDVNYTLEDGIWEDMGTKRVWSLRITSRGAYSLNFILSELFLSAGAELYIFNQEGSMVYGPVTSAQNLESPEYLFLTDLIMGDDIFFQLIEPNISKESSRLRISRVVHAYKNMFSSIISETGLTAAPLNCHNNVTCYPAWDTESNGVALILFSDGEKLATGSLLNNTSQNSIPYFLTAFHCVDTDGNKSVSNQEITAAENWAFRFLYKTTTCNGSVVTNYITYNQAYYRAGSANTDFALMELKSAAAKSDTRLTFLGWNRTTTTPSSGTTIHHPGGDVMKISFDNQPLATNTGTVDYMPTGSLWIAYLDNGSAGPGSSGAPLFDSNKRVVGVLRGGPSAVCPPNVLVRFGKFDVAWTGDGTNSTRLSNWLNPTGSSATTLNSMVKISGPDLVPCTGTITYTLPAISASSVVTWNVGNLQAVSGQGTKTITVQKSSSSSPSTLITANITTPSNISVLQKSVDIGAPYVRKISGPSTAKTGNRVIFYAEPIFPASEGDYDWIVSPATASIYNYRHTCDIIFNYSGDYVVGVRSTNSCISPGSYMTTYVSVNSNYIVSSDQNKRVTVSLVGDSKNTVMENMSQTAAYTLYNQSTGAIVARGNFPLSGSVLDFNHLANGIYILVFDTYGTSNTHKIILK